MPNIMNQRKFAFLAGVFCVILMNPGCQESEEIKPQITPFYNLWEGYWYLDSTYLLNGEVRHFDEVERATRISFGQNNFNWTSDSYGATSNTLTRYDFSTGKELPEKTTKAFRLGFKSGYHSCYFKIENEIGLFFPYLNSYPRPTDLNSILLEVFDFMDDEGCYGLIDIPYSSDAVWKAWSDYIQVVTKYEGIDVSAPLINELTYHDVDFFYFNGSKGPPPNYFRIKEQSSGKITLEVMLNYYNRIIDGKKVLDICTITLYRDNTSGIITIPPFHPNNYSYSWWHSLGAAQNGLTVHGGASFNANGIDSKCLYINGAGQYAEFDKKPYAPMTLSFWVKPITVSRPKQVLYSKYKNQYGPFLFSLEQDKFVMEINDGNGNLQKVTSGRSILEDEWNHICLTVNANDFAILYINGEADSQGTINSLNNDATAKILFGTAEEALINGVDVNFRGYLDEIIFFNKVFGAGEVKQLFLWHKTN